MKLKLLLIITALVLTLCFILTACGEQQTDGATADSATPDSAVTLDKASAPANAASSAPDEEASPASSSAASSAVEAAPAVEADNDAPNVSHEEDTPVQEEQQEEEKSSPNAAPSSQASSASSGNPAYQDSEKPAFTISMTNKSTKKKYSAACSYTTDKEEVASAAFFLPGGDYEIAVYEYTESKDKGEPLAQATYKNSIAEDKRKSIHVNYTPKDNKIEVVVSVSSRTQ